MARYREAVCRLCRREGTKLFLKGRRCLTDKCAIEKRNFAPGQHGKARRPKLVGYGLQLREKQKVRRFYGILEDQFRSYFEKAARMRGSQARTCCSCWSGVWTTSPTAWALPPHAPRPGNWFGMATLKSAGHKVNIPAFPVAPGQEIAVREKSRQLPCLQQALDLTGNKAVPPWLEFNRETLKGRVISLPKREDVNFPIQEQMIVELYSK